MLQSDSGHTVTDYRRNLGIPSIRKAIGDLVHGLRNESIGLFGNILELSHTIVGTGNPGPDRPLRTQDVGATFPPLVEGIDQIPELLSYRHQDGCRGTIDTPNHG